MIGWLALFILGGWLNTIGLFGRLSAVGGGDILGGPQERIAPSGLSLSSAKAQCADITGLVDPGSGG